MRKCSIDINISINNGETLALTIQSGDFLTKEDAMKWYNELDFEQQVYNEECMWNSQLIIEDENGDFILEDI